MRTVDWHEDGVRLIDQRLLPNRVERPVYHDYAAVAQAIKDMVVRGAPAIGATAAFGLALAGFQSQAADRPALLRDLQQAATILRQARPTAVNLSWALDRLQRVAGNEALDSADAVRQALLAEAQTLADEDVALNRRMGFNGAALVEDGDTILHHCNTGALAAVDFGTALGVVFAAHEQGKRVHVLVDETRPRLQGARLTAWELGQAGIPYEIIADGAAGHFLHHGAVNLCLVGADRVAANGDVANKIGTYSLSVLARENGVPFYSVVPTSTVDLSLAHGDLIPIEERSQDEVLGLQVGGEPVAPAGARARNPAFDVTPHRYLTAIITENGVVRPPYLKNLARAVRAELLAKGRPLRIVITGSIAYDYIMSFPGQFKDHILPDKLDSLALSFLVESMTKHRGGVAPNIGYTLALLGEHPAILATAGHDFGDYREWLESVGVDTRPVKIIHEVFTASFFAGKDRINGQIALFYPGAMGHASEVSFAGLGYRPDFAVISPDDPDAMNKHLRECLDLGIPYAYDVSWQLARLPAAEILEGVLGCRMLVVNDYEMGMITDKTGMLETDPRLADKIVAVTRGENGATIYAGGERYNIPVVVPRQIMDPTGAGDAFRGGLLRGMAAGWDWAIAGRMGALAATYCLEVLGPQTFTYTRAEFVARYRENFDDDGVLDALL